WRKGKVLHSHLDVDKIEKGTMSEVPDPEPAEIPARWRQLIKDEIGPHGTLVVWTGLDRVTWKSSKALLENAEFLVGRMYRYFIDQGKVSIRLAAFEESGSSFVPTRTEWLVRPNDPLYLMKGTSAPEPYDQQAAFDFLDQDELKIKYDGKDHVIK